MSRELSELNLQEDFEKVHSCEDSSRWVLAKEGTLGMWVSMYPLEHPEEVFQARLLWVAYPEKAPSLKFRDPASGRLDLPTAWPILPGFRPTSLDACVNWCAEGFAVHPEWRNDPKLKWDSRGNALLKVLRILQFEFDNHFQGRYRP
jgi:hypothetical protein